MVVVVSIFNLLSWIRGSRIYQITVSRSDRPRPEQRHYRAMYRPVWARCIRTLAALRLVVVVLDQSSCLFHRLFVFCLDPVCRFFFSSVCFGCLLGVRGTVCCSIAYLVTASLSPWSLYRGVSVISFHGFFSFSCSLTQGVPGCQSTTACSLSIFCFLTDTIV